MRSRIFSAILFFILPLFFSSFQLNAQTKFEGKVTMKFTENNRDHFMDYFMKGDKIRMEMNEQGQAMNIIVDKKADKMIMLMPNQQMYMEYPYKKLMMNNDEENETEQNFKKTDETKTINGYKCEKWIFNEKDGGISIAWMTKDLGGFTFFDNPMQGDKNKPEWQTEIEAAGLFPMMVINQDENGKEKESMEVTSIEKKNLDDSMFEAPANYQKMQMPMMK